MVEKCGHKQTHTMPLFGDVFGKQRIPFYSSLIDFTSLIGTYSTPGNVTTTLPSCCSVEMR